MRTRLTVNHKFYDLDLRGHETLLEVLRDQLALTGTKSACLEGECGACTVMINGRAVLACLILAADVAGDDIQTIEGLASADNLHPLQESFLEHGAVQCGFCSPGMIMSAKALLDVNPSPTLDEIKTAIAGNICRCAGYPKIFDAIKHAGHKHGRCQTLPPEEKD